MGNGNDRLALYQPGHCLLNNRLVLRVDVGGRLIENDDRRVFQHGSGNGNSLPFSSGKMGTASAHHRLITIFQAADKSVTTGGFSYGLHLSVACAGFAHADVFAHSFVKQVVLLGNKSHLIIKLRQRDFFQVMSAQSDGTLFHVPEAADQLGNGRFTRTAWSYKGGHCARRYGERDIVQNFLVFVVTERYMIDLDI